jgi:glycosyltransferase involved in cell wall biosynthesis
MLPVFSIITINLNNAEGLGKTIESIVFQSFTDFEYIIIDGGSTDSSVEIIKQFADKITSWISEPDRGIYNAMNKGIAMAKGEYLLFINSGDYLFDNEVLAKSNQLIDHSAGICSGNLMIIEGSKKTSVKPLEAVSLYYCLYHGLTHPNTFIKHSLFDKHGLYNEENKVVSDWEFFLVALGLNNASYQAIDVNVACFHLNGVSADPDNPVVPRETKTAMEKHIPRSILHDLERLHYLEEKMNSANYRGLEFIEKYPKASSFFLLPLRLMNFIRKKYSKK